MFEELEVGARSASPSGDSLSGHIGVGHNPRDLTIQTTLPVKSGLEVEILNALIWWLLAHNSVHSVASGMAL